MMPSLTHQPRTAEAGEAIAEGSFYGLVARRLGILVGGSVVFWALLTWGAGFLMEEPPWLFTTTALALCLVPAAGTLIWFSRVAHDAPQQQLVALLGGTGIRLAFVLGAGMGLHLRFPLTFSEDFLIWLLVFYLFTLLLEVRLLVHRK